MKAAKMKMTRMAMQTSVLKGSLKAIKLGGADRGGMQRMEIPKFNLVVVFVIFILCHDVKDGVVDETYGKGISEEGVQCCLKSESLCSWIGDGEFSNVTL